MKYTTSYSSSNGQPSNGHKTHETLNAALSAWKANIRALLHRSGGDSTILAWEDNDLGSEHAQPAGTISWNEHCEGGYATASGIFEDDMIHYGRYENENGDTLTAAKVVHYFSE